MRFPWTSTFTNAARTFLECNSAQHVRASVAAFCIALAIPSQVLAPTFAMPNTREVQGATPTSDGLDVAQSTIALVEKHYLDRSALEGDAWLSARRHLAEAHTTEQEQFKMAAALVRGLGDKYSRVLTSADVRRLLRTYDSSGGLNLEREGEGLLQVGMPPLPGSKAEQAGVRQGDRVLSIGGRDTTRMSVDEAEALFAGDSADMAGAAEVAVQFELVMRPSQGDTQRRVALTSGPVPVALPSSSTRRLHSELFGRTGYVGFREFTRSSGAEAREALLRLQDQGATKVVLDLRGNGGGSFASALTVAGLFLETTPPMASEIASVMTTGASGAPPGPLVVVTTDAQGMRQPHYSRSVRVWEGDLEVWVDGQTASASEIVVGALQDACRGRVVGRVGMGRTYGKGIVQRLCGPIV